MSTNKITDHLSPEAVGPKPTFDEPAPAEPTSDDRTLAIWCHIGGYFTSFVVPLILWLAKKEEGSPFVQRHAREALNYQITQLVYFFLVMIADAGLLAGLGLTATVPWHEALLIAGGAFLLACFVFGGLETLLVILASVAAYRGRPFRYPLCIRLI